MKLFNLSLFFFLFSLNISAQTHQLSIKEKEKIDNLFKKWDKPNSPGASIGIVQNGEMLYSKGYGMANLEHNVLNSPQTAFNVASNTKQFTAACIILLYQQGKLDLNQSLKSVFPGFPDYANDITINHLLKHTSGLRDYPQLAYLTGLRPNDYYNDINILKWIRNQKGLNFLPGEKYMYSNSGYWLLGQLVKRISGMSLAKYAQKELFKPLGMNSTYFFNNNLVIKNMASGYRRMRSGEFITFRTVQENIGDSGLYTTIEDIKKWDDEFYNKTFLNKQFWTKMTTKGVLNNGKAISYASGLEIKEYKGLKTISHGGREPGFWSDIIRFPKQKFTVIVFTNSSNVNAAPLAYKIVDILLAEKLKTTKKKNNLKRNNKFVNISGKILEKYQGNYWNTKDNSPRKVSYIDGKLIYKRGPGSIHTLKPISMNEFKVMKTPPFIDAYVRFVKNEGKYELQTTINGEKSSPIKMYTPIVFKQKELQMFTGQYYGKEIETIYKIKLEDKKLWLYIKDRKIVPLTHGKDLLFSSPMCDFEFLNNNGKINSFMISTPRVKNLGFQRIK